MLLHSLPEAPKPLAFSVIRVPFFLEPHYDENKVFETTNRERLVDKWGGVAGWEAQKSRHDLKGRGLEAGIPHFNLDRLAANSMASHRLIQHIGKEYGLGVSEAIYDKLNDYYFVQGHSLNDRPRLAETVSTELEKIIPDNPPSSDYLLDFLNGNEGRKEIEQALDQLHALGVHGIPKFIIEGSTVVDGAARADVFVRIFRDIERRGRLQNPETIFGSILGIPGEIIESGSYHVEDFTMSA